MTAITAYLLPFLFNWILLFVVCLAVVEFGQNYLYDEATPSAVLKVAAGSALLAVLLTWTRTSYDKMFTSEVLGTVLLAVAAFLVFTFVFRFHPHHGAAIGIASVLLFSGMSSMALESFRNRNRPDPASTRVKSQPIRRPLGGLPTPPPPASAPAAK